ncbi:transposase [Flavobacterium sp. DSR2-3-3]|uniref:transposase n=1 Tax=Flavobacterium sp. DSR2-3-3 TaxID=2804632 RepID=UPI003CF415A4
MLFHVIEIPVEYDNANCPTGFLEWLEKLNFSTICGDLALQGKIRILKFIKSEYLEIVNLMRAYCRKEHKEDYNLLKSIPGFWGFLASVVIAECGDLRRFNTEGQFASFISIVPGMHNSGGSEKCLGITPRSKS